MYGIEELLENYTESELAEGGKLALSEFVAVREAGSEDREGSWTELDVTFPQEKGRRSAPISAKAGVDEENGELVFAECSCAHFEEDGYACPHIVAAQVAWLMRKNGAEAMKNSPLGELLVKKTGLADPFVPGILRRTSGGLLELMEARETTGRAIPRKGGSAVSPGSLRLELYMSIPGKKIFELKIGRDRSYVVKDVRQFLDAFESRSRLEFGKSLSFTAGEELLNSDGRMLLGLLMELYNLEREDHYHYFCKIAESSDRYVRFSGRYYDTLMELMEGKVFYGEDNAPLTFCSEEYHPEIVMEKLEMGAVLHMKPFTRLTRTERWLYLREDGKVFRIALEHAEKFARMLELLEQQKELFVAERDIPRLCRNALVDIRDRAGISCVGMSIEQYLPDKPVIRLYLDCPQNDMIDCRAEACYGEQVYPLGLKYDPEHNRDTREEDEALERILPFFQSYEERSGSYAFQGSEEKLYYFLTEAIPQLGQVGELYISDRLKRLKVRPVGSLTVGVSIDGGLLCLDVKSEEFDREELLEILYAYERKKKYYRLKNGSFLKVEEGQEDIFGALSECVRGIRKPTKGEWKLPLFRALYLNEMLKDRDGVTVDGNREYRRLLERVEGAQDSPCEVPASLKGILREYQVDGFRWIRMLKENGFGGILADDMGLGKTLQILAFLLSEKEAGRTGDDIRTLIITPASLVYNWKKEVERYAPSLKVAMITGSQQDRQEMIRNGAWEAEVWITSYDLLKRDIQWYEGIVFANEILDEAQFVKNQTTNAAKSVRLVQSGFRMALTGTPIENRLSELWSIFDYLMPGFLYHYARFRDEVETPIVAEQSESAMARLHCMVHPFILRRLKREVLKELPEKLEEEVSISLEGEQRRLYDAHVQRLKMYLEKQSREEFSQGKLEILAELTKLRQLCCHPGMILENYSAPNAKMEACMEILRQAVDAGHKVLLFSQFTTMLDAIGERLKREEIAYHRIDGSVKKEERMRLVESFDRDDVPVFCISLKAGGTGLNLTAADIVIHFDPWWNLAAQNQATDRTHRIGQTNVVTVYQLIAVNTIEERIVKLQKDKYRLAEDVLSGEGISGILIDREQVLSLLD